MGEKPKAVGEKHSSEGAGSQTGRVGVMGFILLLYFVTHIYGTDRLQYISIIM